ncbi:MAG: transporter [Devosia sp.]|nr:transporter [Devosia sp.]
MKLAGRLAAAIKVLEDMEVRRRPVAEALKDWGQHNRFAGSGDRAAIGNLVYDALRKKASHADVMRADTPRALILSVAVRDWLESPETLNSQFEGDKFAPERVTLDEQECLSLAGVLAATDPARADVPEWCVPSLEASLGAGWIEECQALALRPPLDLRVNTLKASSDRVLKALSRFDPQPTEIAPDGVRMPAGSRDARTPNVQSDEGYLKGWFEVQDQGSQIVSLLVDAKPGEQVLDFCAGAGGKSLALAAAMQNKGQIFAYDSDRPRLAPIYDRLKRNGARNVQVRAPDAGALDDLIGKMNRVVVDAPCTGSGTWRRRPDAKWKLTPETLANRVEQQADILDEAKGFVKPGGVLVFITCSLFIEENAAQIERFLQSNATFEAIDMAAHYRTVFPAATRQPLTGPRPGLTLTPLSTGTDGFYCAVLTRKA